MVERKKDPSRERLVVKGTGYVSPLTQQIQQTKQSTSTSSTVKRPPRGPFVMPSAPIKNVSTHSSTRIAMTQSVQRPGFASSANRFGSVSNLASQKDEQCHCQHPADIEFLQDVYLENMRIRLEMLELENKYLKGGRSEEEEVAGPSVQPSSHHSVNKKRVEFADRRLFNESTSMEQRSSPTKKQTVPPSTDQELFDKLEESYQKEFRLQEKIKALGVETKKLSAAKDDAERQLGRLNSGEKSMSRERHSLMQDNVELQRRLDDLTPLLAAKDEEIERLEIEKTNLIGKIRRLSTTGTTSKLDREASDSSLNGKLIQRQDMRNGEIEKLESQLRQFRQTENELNDEIMTLKRRLKEEQLLIKREQAARENYAQENDRLIKENSEIASKLNRAESLVERHERERHASEENKVSRAQLAELRHNEERMRSEISTLEKRLKSESETRKALEEQLRRHEHEENQVQDSRRKIQEELHALRALSDSLSAENQGLRQEKLSITQRMETLYSKLEDREKEIRHLIQMLEEFQKHFIQTIDRLKAEMNRQAETSNELDEIVRHARQISSSFQQTSSGRQIRTTIKEYVVEQKSPIRSPKKQIESPSKSRQRIVEEDNTIEEEEEISRQSTESISEEMNNEGTVRPTLSPLTSPIRISKPPSSSSASRAQINRSLRSGTSISRTFSEDRQSTGSSLAQKYRRKMS